MVKKIILYGWSVLFLAMVSSAFAGKVELTTYYPAPMGEYQTLSTTENAYFATTSGSVGIGTTTPNYAGYGGRGLTINSLGRASFIELFRNEDVGTDSIVGAWRAGTDKNSAIAGIDFLTGSTNNKTGAISFKVWKSGSLSDAANEAMRISSDGNIGIGVLPFTSPTVVRLVVSGPDDIAAQQLHVRSSDANSGRLEIGYRYDAGVAEYGRLQAWGGVGTAKALLLNPGGGSVGVGTLAPEGLLDVDGAIFFGPGRGKLYSANPGSLTSGCETVLTVNSGNGGANDSIYIGPHINGVTGVIDLVAATVMVNGVTKYTSDISLKKDIATIPEALKKVCDLRGVTYHWKDENRGVSLQMGVIAQEVEKVFPEIVGSDKHGLKLVEYNGLIPPLIEAIKEQQQQINVLKKEVAELKKR